MFDLNAIVNAAIATAVDARLTEVLQQHANTVGALAERITALEARVVALENNPAIGTDTVLEARVVALEQRVDNTTEASEKRIRVIAEAAAEQVMDLHLECYDHDQYDNVVSNWNDEDPTEFVRENDLDSKVTDAVSDALSNATVSISI